MSDKKFDLVGSLIIGFVTAIGGGTIRDILIGRFPVGWLNDRNYLYAILAGYIISYVFKARIIGLKRSMFLFDTVGIGLFTTIGIQTAINFGMNIEVCLIMGVISAVFGGIIRDVLTNEIPLIFRKEIYASACLLGGLVYIILETISPVRDVNIIVSILCVSAIRFFSVRQGWTLRWDRD